MAKPDASKRFVGEPCGKCGETLWYRSSGTCVTCTNRRNNSNYAQKADEVGAVAARDLVPVTEKHYHGLPCERCEGTLRYRSSMRCVACQKAQSAARHEACKAPETDAKCFRGKPCVTCGDTLRYTRDKKCATCRNRTSSALYAKKSADGCARKPWDGSEVSEKHYHGNPCKVCSGTLRYKAAAKACVACAKRRGVERKADPETREADLRSVRKWQRDWYATNPEQAVAKRLRGYGLRPDEYASLLAAQEGKCAICGSVGCSTGKRLAVDHDHTTGKIRGLLCLFCNTAIGKLRDDPDTIAKALEYVKTHKDG
jgi:hypothetical protein